MCMPLLVSFACPKHMIVSGPDSWCARVCGRRLPIATKDGIYAGELNFHLHWTKCEPEYREVFKRIGGIVHASRGLSRVFNSQIDHAVDGLLGVLSSVQAWFASRSTTHLTAMGGLALGAGAVCFIPALLLLPLFITVRPLGR